MNEFKDMLYKSLGLLSINYSSLENNLKNMVTALLGIDFKTGEIITCNQSFPSLLKLADALYRHKINDQDLLDELKSVVKNINKCSSRRNALIHSMWYSNEPELGTIRIKNKLQIHKGLKTTWESADIEDINDLLNDIKNTNGEISGLLIKTERKGYITFFDLPTSKSKYSKTT